MGLVCTSTTNALHAMAALFLLSCTSLLCCAFIDSDVSEQRIDEQTDRR